MKKVLILFGLLLVSGLAAFAQVSINTDGAAPDNSAMLDVKSTAKGVLLPRMTRVQRNAIVSPETGLMIFQTDFTPGFYYNSGTAAGPVWVMTGTGSGWGLAGNSGTSAATNFIGTTDDVPIAFKINNELAGKIDRLPQNTSLGYKSLAQNMGYRNTAFGYNVLYSNTTGSENTATGYNTLYFNSTGTRNTACGVDALYYNTTGTNNTANGYSALTQNTTGHENSAFGEFSLYYNTTGFGNSACGVNALFINSSGNYNTATGFSALHSNSIGSYNTASGYYSLVYNYGDNNTATGANALSSNTTGYQNTSVGADALNANTQGVENTACGFSAGSAGDVNNFCSFFGWDADQVTGTDYNNSTAIGYQSRITSHGQVRIGSSAVISIGGYAGWTNLSDGRYKKDVQENVPGLAFINQLKPVTYHLDVTGLRNFLGEEVTGEEGEEGFREKTPEQKAIIEQGVKAKEKITYTGFIAQDVEKAADDLGFDFSGVDKPQNENSLYGLRYAEFVVPLVKAVQELNEVNGSYSDAIEALKLEIERLKATNEQLMMRLENLENK